MAYKQNFGRPSEGRNGEPFAKKGLITPTIVNSASSDNTLIGTGNTPVVNELEPVMLGTVKKTKPLSNREESIQRQKQTKAGKGNLLNRDPSYSPNQNITRTTSTINRETTDGRPYSLSRNTFTNVGGGESYNVDNNSNEAFIDGRSSGFFSNKDAQNQATKSENFVNSEKFNVRQGGEMQNFGTFVMGGRDSGQPISTFMQNLKTGSIVGQLSGEGVGRTLGETTPSANRSTNEFAKHDNTNTQLLDGSERRTSFFKNMTPEQGIQFIKNDSLSGQSGRFGKQAFKGAIKFKNQMFNKDITDGS
jgi:hypothetical protein